MDFGEMTDPDVWHGPTVRNGAAKLVNGLPQLEDPTDQVGAERRTGLQPPTQVPGLDSVQNPGVLHPGEDVLA